MLPRVPLEGIPQQPSITGMSPNISNASLGVMSRLWVDESRGVLPVVGVAEREPVPLVCNESWGKGGGYVGGGGRRFVRGWDMG